jgi:transcriptional regulator with XRE-family HTH domain
MSVIGDNISYMREKKLGMRLDFFAKALGVTPNTVINWESGKSIPRSTKLKILCDFLKEKRLLSQDFQPENFRTQDLEISDQEDAERKNQRSQELSEERYFRKLSDVLLKDEKTVKLMQITTDEAKFLQSFRFDLDFIPSKQFYIDALYDYRDYVQNRKIDF